MAAVWGEIVSFFGGGDSPPPRKDVWNKHWVSQLVCVCVACLGEYEISSGDGPLPMAIFELLEYIVNEVSTYAAPQSSQSRSSGSPGNLQSLLEIAWQCSTIGRQCAPQFL